MPDRDFEKKAAAYFADLTGEERRAAFERVNATIKLSAPVEEVDPPPPIHNLAEYFAMDLEVPPALVGDCEVLRGEITATIARAGRGKTTLLTNRLVRWSAGMPLFDDLPNVQNPAAPLRMLLIENEGSGYYLRENMEKLFAHIDMTPEQKELAERNLMVWGDGGYTGLKVDRDNDIARIERALTEHHPDVLCLEPFRGIWAGDENDNSAMEEVLDILIKLADTHNCAILLSHHSNKAPIEGDWMGASRGATALEGKVAVMEVFYPVHNDEQREIKWVKKRYGKGQMPGIIRMSYSHETRGLTRVPDSEIEAAVLRFMSSDEPPLWWTKAQIAEEVEETQDRLEHKAIRPLLDQGRIIKKNRDGSVKYRCKVGDEDKKDDLDF